MAIDNNITIYDSESYLSFPAYVKKSISEIRIYRFALYNFVINNLKTRYRRSVLGFLWTLLNPLLLMTIITLVFSLVFKQDLKTFAVFIISGLSPWSFIQAAIIGGGLSMVNSEGFLKRVYLPKILFPLIAVSTEAVNFIFSVLALYIIVLIVGAKLSWTMLLLPFVLVIAFIFCLGCSLLLSVATVYFRDLSHITIVAFNALFYMAPIIYPMESLPEKFRQIFFFNPFYYFISLFRKVIVGGVPFTVIDWLIPFLLAIVTFSAGLYFLMKRDQDLIFRL